MSNAANKDEARVTIAFTGDVVLSRPVYIDGRLVDDEVGTVEQLLGSADIALASLLSPFSDRGAPIAKMVTLRADPQLAGDLGALGFTAMHLSNNHSMDLGEEGLVDTIENLRRHGVRAFGAGRNLEQATEGLVIQVGDRRVGLLAWSALLPAGTAAGADRAGVAPLDVEIAYEFDPLYLTEEPTYPPTVRSTVREASLAPALDRIRTLRREVDVLLVVAHWGIGVGDIMDEYMQPLGRALIDAGADAVLGTHPHSVYGVDFHDGRPIFYSPGLFIDQTPRVGNSPDVDELYSKMSPDSYVAMLTFAPDRAVTIELVPTTLGDENLPVVASGDAAQRVLGRLRQMSKPYPTSFEPTGDRIVVSATR
jgi:poly-gamma-glutamate capsule biosynthesis protein CapA/YwtB (metallophosphatase superfamily)